MLTKFLTMLRSCCKQRGQSHRGRSRRAPSQPREPRAPSQPRMLMAPSQPRMLIPRRLNPIRTRNKTARGDGGAMRLMMATRRAGMTSTRMRSKMTAGCDAAPPNHGTIPHGNQGRNHGRMVGGRRRHLGRILAPSHRHMLVVAPGITGGTTRIGSRRLGPAHCT